MMEIKKEDLKKLMYYIQHGGCWKDSYPENLFNKTNFYNECSTQDIMCEILKYSDTLEEGIDEIKKCFKIKIV